MSMGAETMAAVALVVAATTATTSAVVAVKNTQDANEAAKKREEAIARSVGLQQEQLAAKAGLEKLKRINEAAHIDAGLRVASGESGIGIGGTFMALQQQSAFDLEMNKRLIESTLSLNQRALVASGGDAIAQEAAKQQNVLLSGVTAGLSGYQVGLKISSGFEQGVDTLKKLGQKNAAQDDVQSIG